MKRPKKQLAPKLDLSNLIPLMLPDSRGITAVEIARISQSVIDAKRVRLAEDQADPIHRWATVAPVKDHEDHEVPPAIAAAIGRAVMDHKMCGVDEIAVHHLVGPADGGAPVRLIGAE